MVFWCKSHKSWQYVITLSLFRSRTLCVTRPWAAWRRGWCVARAWTPPPSPPTSSSSCRSTKTSTDCQIQTGLPGISLVKSIGGKVITKNISVNMVLTLQSLVPSSNKTPRPAPMERGTTRTRPAASSYRQFKQRRFVHVAQSAPTRDSY